MGDMNYVTRETGGFVASLQLFAFLQDNIQLIIYSRTDSETIKKDIATLPQREKTEALCASVQPAEPILRTAQKWRGKGSHCGNAARRLGG